MDSTMIVIYRGKPMDAEIVKEILEDNGIMANLNNQILGTLVPWQVTPGGLDPVEVVIMSENKEKALELIEAFNQSV